MRNRDKTIIRAALSTYAVFTTMWGVLFVPAACLAIKKPTWPMWEGPLAIGCIGLFITTWIASFRIVLGPDTFSYRTLFSGTQCVRREDVSSARFEYKSREDRIAPLYQLVIRLRSESQESERIMRINAKVFSLQDLRLIMDYFGIPRPQGRSASKLRR